MSEGVVEFTHTNWKGKTLDRCIIPHRLGYMEYQQDSRPITVLCLVGFCLDKQAIRTFKLSDVENKLELCLDLIGKVDKRSTDAWLEELKSSAQKKGTISSP